MHQQTKTSLATLAAALACACGPLAEEVRPIASPPSAQRVAGAEPGALAAERTEPISLPGNLTCVSEPSTGDGEQVPHLWRVSASFGEPDATLHLSRGPLFRSRSGTWLEADGEPEEHTARVSLGATLRLDDEPRLAISLEKRGAFFHGTLARGGSASSLVCWDAFEIFGSAWADLPSPLVATFDWATGACRDVDGDPALNALPLEFVRETGYGECADLRGVLLNEGDLGGPDLFGWNLVGADLTGAQLYFAQLTAATLHGADLSGLVYGYAHLEGTVDENTRLPEEGLCETSDGTWGGTSLSCVH